MPELTPIELLKEMIETDQPRAWIIKPTEDGAWINLVEKTTLAQFEMTNKEAMDIVIENLEQSIFFQKEIPAEQEVEQPEDEPKIVE